MSVSILQYNPQTPALPEGAPQAVIDAKAEHDAAVADYERALAGYRTAKRELPAAHAAARDAIAAAVIDGRDPSKVGNTHEAKVTTRLQAYAQAHNALLERVQASSVRYAAVLEAHRDELINLAAEQAPAAADRYRAAIAELGRARANLMGHAGTLSWAIAIGRVPGKIPNGATLNPEIRPTKMQRVTWPQVIHGLTLDAQTPDAILSDEQTRADRAAASAVAREREAARLARVDAERKAVKAAEHERRQARAAATT